MISSCQQKTFQSLRVILILTKTHTHIYTHTHTYMCVFSLFGLYLNLNGHQSICHSVQIWIRLKKLVFLGIITKSLHSQICCNIYYLQKFIWTKNWFYLTIFSEKFSNQCEEQTNIKVPSNILPLCKASTWILMFVSYN